MKYVNDIANWCVSAIYLLLREWEIIEWSFGSKGFLSQFLFNFFGNKLALKQSYLWKVLTDFC